jgi:hypothetical protein
MRIRSGTVAIDESFHEETKPAALKRDESYVNLVREHESALFPSVSAPFTKALTNLIPLSNAFVNAISISVCACKPVEMLTSDFG